MAKHSWLTKPSMKKALRLWIGFYRARISGWSVRQSKVFAGYYLERTIQGSDLITADYLLMGTVASNWKILEGRNVDNYLEGFNRHKELIYVHACFHILEGYKHVEELKYSQHVPYKILRDKLLDLGMLYECEFLDSIFQDD